MTQIKKQCNECSNKKYPSGFSVSIIDYVKKLFKGIKCYLMTRHRLVFSLVKIYPNGDQNIRANCDCVKIIKFYRYDKKNNLSSEIKDPFEYLHAFCFQKDYEEYINPNFKIKD